MSRFLVIEDYPPLSSVIALALRRKGHAVVRAGSAVRAYAAEGYFEGGVVDVDLPDGNGVDVAASLLADHRVGEVFFFTATRDEELIAKALSLGLVVDKAAGLDRLLRVIEGQFSSAEEGEAQVVNGEPLPFATRVNGRSGWHRKVT